MLLVRWLLGAINWLPLWLRLVLGVAYVVLVAHGIRARLCFYSPILSWPEDLAERVAKTAPVEDYKPEVMSEAIRGLRRLDANYGGYHYRFLDKFNLEKSTQEWWRLTLAQMEDTLNFIIGCFIVMPVRWLIVFTMFCFYLCCLMIGRAVLPAPKLIEEFVPVQKTKTIRFLRQFFRYYLRSVVFIIGLVKINNHWIEGAQRVEDPAFDVKSFVVCNHVSAMDVMLFLIEMCPGFVAKASVEHLFFAGASAKILHCIFVRRENEEDKKRVLEQLKARHEAFEKQQARRRTQATKNESLEDTYEIRPLCIFAEGTTSNGVNLLPFKRGAFECLRPITPVVICYRTRGFHWAFDLFPFGNWMFLLFMSCHPASVDIYWLPEMAPDPQHAHLDHTERVNHFKEEVRQKMQRVLTQVGGYEDKEPLRLPPNWEGALRAKKEISRALFNNVSFFETMTSNGQKDKTS